MVIGRWIIGRVLVLVAVLGVAGVMAASSSAAPVAPHKPAGGPRTSARLSPRTWSRPAAATHVLSAASGSSARTSGAAATPITACGTEITTPGTYSLSTNLTDTGSYCVWIATDKVTLNLNGHKITGDGSDACILVEDKNMNRSVRNDTINGKGALNGCQYGIEAYSSTRTAASKLTISPGSASTSSDSGVYEEYSVDNSYSSITVKDSTGSAYGFYMIYGSGNKVSSSSVHSTGSPDSFYVEYEYGDSLSGNTATYPNGAGGSGYGFVEYYSNRDSYTGDTATGQLVGFYLYEDTYGTVTATNNTYSNPTENNTSSYGFYNYYNYDDNNYGYQNHSTVSGNTVDGGYYGYFDEYDIAEAFTSNTAKDNDGYGFYFEYPADYTITGNTSNGSPNFIHDAYGFYFDYAYSYYAPKAFNNNTSEYNYYGFYADSNSYAIHGTGNKGMHNTHDSYRVEVGS